jgi:hypothetical protein
VARGFGVVPGNSKKNRNAFRKGYKTSLEVGSCFIVGVFFVFWVPICVSGSQETAMAFQLQSRLGGWFTIFLLSHTHAEPATAS